VSVLRELVDTVLPRAWRRESPVHGDEHWRCVISTGMALAAETPRADARLAFVFGLLHDTRRENEHRDPEHGPRAAAFARELHGEGALPASPRELELLARALELHSDGLVADDPTTAVCWDADRLHLPRVGITPDPARYSTPLALSDEWAAQAAAERQAPPSWDEVLAAVSRGPVPESYRAAGRVFAGEYPGAERLAAFSHVDVFVDLTHPDDGLPPYEGALPVGARRVSVPVADFSVPSPETIVRALDAVDEAVADGRSVYVHCWGGRGRTGTVVGCWFVRHGATGEEALRRVAELRGAGPETEEQRGAVLGWQAGR
jgi:uncharacterized protein